MTTRRRRRGQHRKAAAAAAAGTVLAAGLGLAAAPGSGAAPTATPVRNWVIDVNSLVVDDALLSTGDAPLVGYVAFRTRLGVAGSTQVTTSPGFTRVCTGAQAGTTCAVPDAAGRVQFGSVRQLDAPAMAAGGRPELIGMIHVMTLPDVSYGVDLAGELRAGAENLRLLLAARAERLTAAELATPEQTAQQAARIVDAIGNTMPVGVRSDFGDKVTALIAVDTSVRDTFNLAMLAGVHAPATAGAAVDPRILTFAHTFAPQDGWYHGPPQPPLARYRTTQQISSTPITFSTSIPGGGTVVEPPAPGG